MGCQGEAIKPSSLSGAELYRYAYGSALRFDNVILAEPWMLRGLAGEIAPEIGAGVMYVPVKLKDGTIVPGLVEKGGNYKPGDEIAIRMILISVPLASRAEKYLPHNP